MDIHVIMILVSGNCFNSGGIHVGPNHNDNINLTEICMIFGYFNESKKYALNNCLLETTYFIHCYVCKKERVSFRAFLRYFRSKLDAEQHII